MDFKNHRIGQDHNSWNRKKVKIIAITAGVIIVGALFFGIYSFVRSLDISSIIFSFGKTLHTDESGHTNILLVGVGGEGHDGADLTDSIIVASIDYDHKLVPMLSIPRDLYVKSEKLKSSERINAIYSLAKSRYNSKIGLEELKNITGEIVGIPLDYVIKVDFAGFKKIVDSLEGVDVTVEKDIYDTEYPLEETGRYETFELSKGPQHLNGDLALKFARSRHGKGNEIGDFDRAKRQQQLLSAIKEKALHLNILTDAGKIKNLYDSIASSIETDLNLNEIIELAKIAKDFGKENVISRVLSDVNQECGGFLYAPAKELFSGASVLLPIGNNYDHLHRFTQLFFRHTTTAIDQSPIVVLNGTKTPIAREFLDYLNRFCFNAIYATNAENRQLTSSTVYYIPDEKSQKPPAVDFIEDIFKTALQPELPPIAQTNVKVQPAKIIIELGSDYLSHRLNDPLRYGTAGSSATPTRATPSATGSSSSNTSP